MLSILLFAQSLKWVVPAVLMLGTAPNYFCLWGAWRILSAPFPKKVYRRGDDFFYALYQRYILFFFESLTGLEVVLYGDAEDALQKKENVIFMCNHQCTVDWMVADFLAVRQGSLGSIRYILKDGLKYLPLYGFYFKMHGCIYVKRSGKYKGNKASKQLNKLAANNVPFWMVVFPEGTRFNPELPKNIEKSRQFAIEQGLQPLDSVLTPRHKAVGLCIDELREKADAVYDVTIGYPSTKDKEGKRVTAPGLPDFLSGCSPQVHVHLNRIQMEDVPREEEKFKLWLHDRYIQKDRMMKTFYSNDPTTGGTLGKATAVSKLSIKHTLPAFVFFTGFNAAILSTEEGRSLYWKSALFGTAGTLLWMVLRSES